MASDPSDAGFITPAVGVSAVALAVIAVAAAQLVRTEEMATRRDVERRQTYYAVEGVATIAAWRILHDEGAQPLAWIESTGFGDMRVRAEPEARKLSIMEIGGALGQARLSALVGSGEAAELMGRLQALAPVDGSPPSRRVLLQQSSSTSWRDCGLTLVSTFSRLTDNALGSERAPDNGELNLREGEVWRITVALQERPVLDRLVRFTGDVRAPAAVVDHISSPAASHNCITTISGSGELDE